MEVIDISMRIEGEMAVYPGNPRPELERYRQLPEDSTTETRITIGSHTGTHADAPSHVFEDGEPATAFDLEEFYGPAEVVDLTGCTESVGGEDVREAGIEEDIALLKTGNSFQQYRDFREDFTYLEPSAVEALVETGVRTVGIDYLSLVEFEGGESAEKAHRRANREMNVVEGLRLDGVEPGRYIFSGMPLKIEADGAPMRAVLIRK